jgi:nitrate reductase assembly molybdenum cofactor insertion protein NarJ
MSSLQEQFEAIAGLFTYPRSDYAEAVKHAVAHTDSAMTSLPAFANDLGRMPLTALQELYTKTFDLQPVCTLDLGWHLFGEDYRRGLLLARMRRELRAHDIPETCELPDHLSYALLLLARMDPTQGEKFAAAIVIPALEQMLKSLPAENPFNHLLQAVQQLITIHLPLSPELVFPQAEGAML